MTGSRVRKPLWAAEIKEDAKKKDDAKKLRSVKLTERDVDYIKTPLVFETTGAFGKEAKNWFKKVQLELSTRITATRSGLQEAGLCPLHIHSGGPAMTTTSHVAAAHGRRASQGTGGAACLDVQQED
jgi:hypothetical protein